jgi:hypothetical protein
LVGRLLGELNSRGHSTSVRPRRVRSTLVVTGAVQSTNSPSN